MAVRNKGLPVEWTKHLSADDKKDFEAAVRNDTLVLGRLLEIVDDSLRSVNKMEHSLSAYENSAWPYKQAHMNGVKGGLTKIRNLLDFLET